MNWQVICYDGNTRKFELLGCSYNCPSMKLFGYATEKQLDNAITRKLIKSHKKFEVIK
jgi:hypothetical protein